MFPFCHLGFRTLGRRIQARHEKEPILAEGTEAQTDPPPRRRRRPTRIGRGVLSSLTLATVLLTVVVLSASGRAVPWPDWLTERVVASVNDRLYGGRLSLRDVAVAIGPGGQPVARMTGVSVFDARGGRVAALNQLDAQLSLGALLQGRLSADRLTLNGAQITIRRDVDGRFSLAEASGDTQAAVVTQSIGDLLSALDQSLSEGVLAALGEVEASDVVISLEDARSGRLWQATNAQVFVRERPDGISLSVSSDVFNGTDALAQVQVSFAFEDETRETQLGVSLEDFSAVDIALQSPVLAWLGVLDAPISGSVRATIRGDGQLSALDGTLDISEGALLPVEGVKPVAFERANAYFTFDAERSRLEFAEIGVVSDTVTVIAEGHTDIGSRGEGVPDEFVGQFQVREAVVNAGDLFEAPVAVDELWADLRMRLDPFTLDMAQVVSRVGDVTARATGKVQVRNDAWEVAVDATSAAIGRDEVLAFWPLKAGRKVRPWLSENLHSGELSNASLGVRAKSGRKPDVSMSFDFEDAVIRYLPEMPEILDGAGRAALNNKVFTVKLDKGFVKAADGGTIDGSGSVFQVPDTRERPIRGALDLTVEGPLASVLDVLDNPPLSLMSRAGRPAYLADASVLATAKVELPLRRGLKKEDISFEVTGIASDMATDVLVPGRLLTSDSLRFRATQDEFTVAGPGQLDGVPLEANWRLPLEPDQERPAAQAKGRVTISADGLSRLGIDLPDGLLSGQGEGLYQLDLATDRAPKLALSSDLRGLGLSIPAIGWRKSRGVAGAFDLALSLGETPSVDNLELSAPGLALSGDASLAEGGELAEVRLRQLRVGNWLDASARLTPRGRGERLGITIEGGRLDLRSLPKQSAADDVRAQAGDPISLSLDTAIVSDGIVLSPLIGRITPTRGGIDGDLEARVSGRTPVRVALTPAEGGTGVRVRAADAGGVLRDAGLTPNGRGGALTLVLTPVAGAAPGTYDGEFRIEGMSLANAPVLAALLDAISVVGLLDRLGGSGIRFDTIDGAFRLAPDRVTLRRLAAIGPSLGISADGVYDPVAKKLDVQGVVSPIYFINGIGAIISRRGEGLFGFNYRLTGPTDGPSISVNPLSILTPGMFRDIFRSPPPAE